MIPKFRAWWKKGRMMFNVATIDFLEKEVKSRANLMFTFDDIELMQSTGLKDKNGREIYNGDIIRFFDCYGDGYTVPVVWDNDYACFSVDWGSNMLASFDYLEEFYTDLKDIEVIGNIYDNPELSR